MDRNRRLATLAGLAAIGSIALPARAQGKWPTAKPITYVVPFAAGGTTDVLARLVGQRLSQQLGTPVIIDNKPGAGGNVGSAYAAKQAPDGYTLAGGTISSHAINVSLYSNIQYDPVKSFEAVTLLGTMPNVLVVNANSPYKTVQDVIAAAKAKPGQLAFGSSGGGTSQHLSAELFGELAGVKLLHVPFKGSAPSMQALLGNQVSLVFENALACIPLIKDGKLRALGVTSSRRSSQLPDVPTLAEAGLKGYEIESWQALFAPAGTPHEIVERVATEVNKILKEPDVQAKLRSLGLEVGGGGPAQLATFQKAEVAKWARLIKTADIHLE